MQYIVKQKIFSLGDSFAIKDIAGNDIFIVRSQILSIGHKLKIFDVLGNELCYIEQKLFRFMPEYNIYIGGQPVINVKKKFMLFKNNFVITTYNMDQYEIDGDFWGHEFALIKNGMIAARISKQFFSFSDTYGVDIDDEEDQVVNLALAIVIDMACHDHDN